MTSEKTKTRRRYGAALKAQVIAECSEPGVSVAQVAMSHGINANVVHRWRQLLRDQPASASPAKSGEFIALPFAAPPSLAGPPSEIRIELRRGTLAMTVTWPASASAELTLWTQELLR